MSDLDFGRGRERTYTVAIALFEVRWRGRSGPSLHVLFNGDICKVCVNQKSIGCSEDIPCAAVALAVVAYELEDGPYEEGTVAAHHIH